MKGGFGGEAVRLGSPSQDDEAKRLIIFARSVAGLFSSFCQVVGQLVECQKRRATPLVYFNRMCPYWSETGYRGLRNAWEYYFHQVSDARIEDWVEADLPVLEAAWITDFECHDADGIDAGHVDHRRGPPVRTKPGVLVSSRYPAVVDPVFDLLPRERKRVEKVVRDRIRVRPEIMAGVQEFATQQFAGRRAIGVHVRGSERAAERRLFVTGGTMALEYYFRELDTQLDRRPGSVIFCATDAAAVVDSLKGRYGSRLVTYPSTRLPPVIEAHGLHRSPLTRPFRAQLGEEALVECLLLARCDYLVHGPSNVSLAARLFRPDLPHTDVYWKYGRSRLVRWLVHLWWPGLRRGRFPIRRSLRMAWTVLSRRFDL